MFSSGSGNLLCVLIAFRRWYLIFFVSGGYSWLKCAVIRVYFVVPCWWEHLFFAAFQRSFLCGQNNTEFSWLHFEEFVAIGYSDIKLSVEYCIPETVWNQCRYSPEYRYQQRSLFWAVEKVVSYADRRNIWTKDTLLPSFVGCQIWNDSVSCCIFSEKSLRSQLLFEI